MDGIELTTRIKQRSPATSVLLVTGTSAIWKYRALYFDGDQSSGQLKRHRENCGAGVRVGAEDADRNGFASRRQVRSPPHATSP